MTVNIDPTAHQFISASLNDALHDGVKQCFAALHMNLVDKTPDAKSKFEHALQKTHRGIRLRHRDNGEEMTTPAINAAEIAAGTKALQTMIAATLPSWQQRLVPADILAEAVQAVVSAVDTVRDAK